MYTDPEKLQDIGYSAGEKAFNDIPNHIFREPYFNYFVRGFIKGFQDYAEANEVYYLHYPKKNEHENT